MEEIDTLEHFMISRGRDGSLWELGRGAMGITYKGWDTNLQSEVALKVISAQYLDSEPARQRFLREARAAASLRHPNNVATVLHLGKVGGRIYYAMEYVNGETVERRVQREGPMHPLLALRIVRQVTGALVAADREKLVHRDIKPSNIMLALEHSDDQLLVKVIDFGLAKSFLSSAHQSGTLTVGGFVGTPHFASPAKETKILHFDLARAVDTLTASASPTPAATSSEGLPALLTAPGLKPEAEGSAPSTSQPGSTPSPTVRPPLQSESATERTGQNRSLSRQPRVFQPVPNQLRQQPLPPNRPFSSPGRIIARQKERHYDSLTLNGTPKGTI